jgi:hypothetical protein
MFRFERLKVWHKAVDLYDVVDEVAMVFLPRHGSPWLTNLDGPHFLYPRTSPKVQDGRPRKNPGSSTMLRRLQHSRWSASLWSVGAADSLRPNDIRIFMGVRRRSPGC